MSKAKLQLIANSYATALFEVATKNKSTEVLYKAFKKNVSFFDLAQVRKILDNPLLSKDDHEHFAKAFDLKGVANDLLISLIKTLFSYSRMAIFPYVLQSYCDLYMKETGECEVTLISAKDLSSGQEQNLKKKLEAYLQKKVSFNKKIQENLKAGFVLEFTGKRLDLSLKGQLKQFLNRGMLK